MKGDYISGVFAKAGLVVLDAQWRLLHLMVSAGGHARAPVRVAVKVADTIANNHPLLLPPEEEAPAREVPPSKRKRPSRLHSKEEGSVMTTDEIIKIRPLSARYIISNRPGTSTEPSVDAT